MTKTQKRPSREEVEEAIKFVSEHHRGETRARILVNEILALRELINQKFDATVEEKNACHALGYEQGKRFAREELSSRRNIEKH